MDTKRGRPKGPEKVVIKMRVLVSDAPKVKRLVDELIKGKIPVDMSEEGPTHTPLPQMASNAKERAKEFISKHDGLFKSLAEKDSGVEARSVIKGDLEKVIGERDELRSQNMALLDDVEELTKQKAYWEDRFNKAVAASESQMINYWRGRATKAEQRVAELESNG